MSDAQLRLVGRRLGSPGSLAAALLRGDVATGLLPPRTLQLPNDAPDVAEARLGLDRIRGGSEALRERLAAVVDGRGVLVTTGQQPMLFLGPLLVLYKAVTALTVAGALRDRGIEAVPLFWVAGDDHDWDEVGTARLLDSEHAIRTVSLDPPPDREGRAVGPTALPEATSSLMDKFFEHLPRSEFIDAYLELIRDAYRPGRTMSEAFGDALGGVLGEGGIPWVDAADDGLRRAAAPLYRRLLEDPDGAGSALRRATQRVREAGHEPQIETGEGALPLFVDREQGRTRLWAAPNGGFRMGREGEPVAASRLLEELEARPERFSPDAALRPVLASWLLPTGVSVLGPSELAYWTQLPDLFEWADVPFPRLRPRDGWTVVEEKIGKVLEKLDVGVDAFDDGGEALARRVRDAGTPNAVREALGEARAAIGRSLEGVEAAVDRELPGIRSAVGAARHRAFEVLDDLEAAVSGRVDEQHEVLLRQIRKAAAHLRPDGRPQERIQSPLYYFARYGDAFLEAVERASREARAADSEAVADPDGPR